MKNLKQEYTAKFQFNDTKEEYSFNINLSIEDNKIRLHIQGVHKGFVFYNIERQVENIAQLDELVNKEEDIVKIQAEGFFAELNSPKTIMKIFSNLGYSIV